MTRPSVSPARLLSVFDRLEARRQNDPMEERQVLLARAMEINQQQQLAYSSEEVAAAVDEELAQRSQVAGTFNFGWSRPGNRTEWERQVAPRWWKRLLRLGVGSSSEGESWAQTSSFLMTGVWLVCSLATLEVSKVLSPGAPFGAIASGVIGLLLTMVWLLGGLLVENREHPLRPAENLFRPSEQNQLVASLRTSPEAERYLMHCLATDVPIMNEDVDRMIHLVAQRRLAELGDMDQPQSSPDMVRTQLLQQVSMDELNRKDGPGTT